MVDEWNEGDNTELAEDVTADLLSDDRKNYVTDALTAHLSRGTITELVQLVLDILETTMGYDFTDYERDDDEDDDEDGGDWAGDDDESEQWNDNDDDAAGQRYD